MNDIFYEQFLSTSSSKKAAMMKALTVIGTTLACLACVLFLGMFFIFPSGVIIVLVLYFIKPRLNKEYEYSLSNFYLDFAAIYNKESRKELLSIDIRDAEILAPAASPRLNHFRPAKTYDFSTGNKNAKAYAFMIPINQVLHKVVLEPDEELLRLLKGRMGSRIYMD